MIKDTVSNHTTHKDTNSTFITLSGPGGDLDPEAIILITRILALRRMLAKRPWLEKTAQRILNTYISNGYIGTDTNEVDAGMSAWAPQPGTGERRLWQPMHCGMNRCAPNDTAGSALQHVVWQITHGQRRAQ